MRDILGVSSVPIKTLYFRFNDHSGTIVTPFVHSGHSSFLARTPILTTKFRLTLIIRMLIRTELDYESINTIYKIHYRGREEAAQQREQGGGQIQS